MPDVSLSKRCTEKGLLSLKNLLFENISIRFFFDLVPPWTGMPEFLLTTIKLSLLSIINFSFFLTISDVAVNFFNCLVGLFMNLKL